MGKVKNAAMEDSEVLFPYLMAAEELLRAPAASISLVDNKGKISLDGFKNFGLKKYQKK